VAYIASRPDFQISVEIVRHTGSDIMGVLNLEPDLRNAVWHRLQQVIAWEREQADQPAAPVVQQNFPNADGDGWRTD
jgi:hypothetical protein